MPSRAGSRINMRGGRLGSVPAITARTSGRCAPLAAGPCSRTMRHDPRRSSISCPIGRARRSRHGCAPGQASRSSPAIAAAPTPMVRVPARPTRRRSPTAGTCCGIAWRLCSRCWTGIVPCFAKPPRRCSPMQPRPHRGQHHGGRPSSRRIGRPDRPIVTHDLPRWLGWRSKGSGSRRAGGRPACRATRSAAGGPGPCRRTGARASG
jgi:hypothetical protein